MSCVGPAARKRRICRGDEMVKCVMSSVTRIKVMRRLRSLVVGTIIRSEPGASRSHSECWQGRFPHTDGKNERTEITDLFVHAEVSKFGEFDVSLAGYDGQIVIQEQCANTRKMGIISSKYCEAKGNRSRPGRIESFQV